ncbi:NEDD4-binding protein 1 [Eupeodes corollae]|uniref:NEDD4-binding protein 1 n=1 Tax=Eupeodes corollae TaxID=290404 RepID=UPI0024917EDA|nr:NEDD4-binding protein 1 [Eupeodes corollae]
MKPKLKVKKSASKQSKLRQKVFKKYLKNKSNRVGGNKTKRTFTSFKSQNRSYSQHLLQMAQYTTNQQTDEPQASTSGASSSSKKSPNKTPIRRKPFEKFKDKKHREELIQKHKLNSRNKFVLGAQSINQTILKKVVHQIKKRNSQIRNGSHNKTKSPSKFVRKGMRSERGEKDTVTGETPLDDDCICIETKPEVILIDDETIAPVNVVKELEMKYLKFKQYEPIGKIRMEQQGYDNIKNNQMITSTPNASRLNGRSLYRVPFHEDTSSSFSSMSSSTICCNTDDVTIVEDVNSQTADVIVIDDTLVPRPNRSSLKRNRSRNDDSVIFVSENFSNSRTQSSSAPAFIPLNTPAEEVQIRLPTASEKSPRLPRKKQRNALFTTQEEKQLKQYNENAYNPNKDTSKEQPQKRFVIVDGSNVAYQHALNKEFSVKGLKICLDYFAKIGHEVKAVVPQHRLQRQRSTDPSELDSLHREGKIVFTPCKNLPGKSSTSYDDRFILQLASELDAAVVSNDNYRDLLNENSAFKKIIENRVIGYTWCNDVFILPKDPYGKWGPTLDSILNRS